MRQSGIQAVLYHHGFPQRRNLMTDGGREWLAAQALPATAREQITVSIAMIDALERRLHRSTRSCAATRAASAGAAH